MDDRLPPLPPRPDFEAKAKTSAIWLILTGFGLLGVFALLALLLTPLLWIGVAIAGIIGLQYLLWGWWFERIYRSQPPDDEQRERNS
jgi:hypothetical protein